MRINASCWPTALIVASGFIAFPCFLVPSSPDTRGSRASAEPNAESQPPHATGVAAPAFDSTPFVFVENRGQWPGQVAFQARRGPCTAWFHRAGWTIGLEERLDAAKLREAVAVRMTFENADALPSGEQPLPRHASFFIGSDRARWAAGVPVFGRIRYPSIYQGIDVVVREQRGHLEYDIELAPGADLASVAVRCEGADRLSVDTDGTLQVETACGTLQQEPPVTWEVLPNGRRRPVTCAYRLLDADRYGFVAPDWSANLPLVIDPGLVWSTFLGGSDMDLANCVALHPSGQVIVGGWTRSQNFPVTVGSPPVAPPSDNVFVCGFDRQGSQLWSTVIGGTTGSTSGADAPSDLVVDSNGDIVVCGSTASSNFPTTPGAFRTVFGGGQDVFVLRLAMGGASIMHSTFFGLNSSGNSGLSIAINGQNDVFVSGRTGSSLLLTHGSSFQPTPRSTRECYVAKLDYALSQMPAATYLGGSGQEESAKMALAPNGDVVVTGLTFSADFPVSPTGFQSQLAGPNDLFVSRLDAGLSTLLAGTYLGGSGSEEAGSVAMDPVGNVTITGLSRSTDYPSTPGAYDTTQNGGADVIVTRLNPNLTSLVYSTYLGGSMDESALPITLDATGAAVFSGGTFSPNFPTSSSAFDPSHNGGRDAFVARLDASGSTLLYATFLGGAGNDFAYDVALASSRNILVVGDAHSSPAFPTTVGPLWKGGGRDNSDAFVLELCTCAPPMSYGSGTPHCSSDPRISASGCSTIGNVRFAIDVSNAVPRSFGWVLLSTASAAWPMPCTNRSGQLVLNVMPSPFAQYFPLPVAIDGTGSAALPLPIPSSQSLRGLQLYLQFYGHHPGVCACDLSPGIGGSASKGLAITVQ